MIRRVFRYRLNLRQFLKEIPSFLWEFARTRSLRSLVVGLPAVLLTLLLLAIFVRGLRGTNRVPLAESYQALALAAVDADAINEADVYLARTIELAADQRAKSLEIATLLYSRGHQSRALEILSSLAPLKHSGYVPAHEFLAKHWREQQPRTDVSTAVAMYHEMHAGGDDEGPRLRLAEFLSDQGVQRKRTVYQEHAALCITNLLHPSAEARLQLVSIYARLGKLRAAENQAKLAEQNLQEIVAAQPNDTETRLLLSKAIACQARMLDAIYVLADGCEHQPANAIVDQLIHLYVVWLSTMEPDGLQAQLKELALVLRPDSVADDLPQQTPVSLSSGELVLLPEAIADLHQRLLAGDGQWIIPVLRAGSLAAKQQYASAAEELRGARELQPENPVISNNLAWILLKQHEQLSDQLLANADSSELRLAWELSESAVARLPQEPAFLETRGQLASVLGEWDQAVSDLQACLSLGHDTPAIRETLAKARKNVL